MRLARKSVIAHPAGISIRTPLLVPSFSSKGFKLYKQKKGGDAENFFQTEMELPKEENPTSGQLSEISDILNATSEILTEAMLVSAYDVFHQHIPFPYLNVAPEIIFFDSGGYEVNEAYDYSEVIRSMGLTNEWDIEKYKEVLDAWPEYVPTVFVSCDHKCRGKPVSEQIESARELLSEYRKQQLCALLIKPVTEELTFRKTLGEICSKIDELRDFDIFAVTEKDLGNSVLLIMENIARLRIAMDEAGINIPIHIFGSLDPLTSCLYFLAGAEIFDGLTWLRYGYFEGRAVYYRNIGILNSRIHVNDDLIKAKNINDNLYYLWDLKQEMTAYLLNNDFCKFRYNSKALKEAFDLLRTKFEERNI